MEDLEEAVRARFTDQAPIGIAALLISSSHLSGCGLLRHRVAQHWQSLKGSGHPTLVRLAARNNQRVTYTELAITTAVMTVTMSDEQNTLSVCVCIYIYIYTHR